MNNHLVPVPSPAVLPSVDRREPERSEGERRAADGKTAGGRTDLALRPNPEVAELAKRRRFTGEYKRRIVAEADQAEGVGAIGALLRREGLYSSLLSTWRREIEAGIVQALAPRPRGPKSRLDPLVVENHMLLRQTQVLAEDLRRAQIVIEIQKKMADLLGSSTPPAVPVERP